jgi:hypothetical protein
MMNNKLAELKVKPGAVVKLIEQPWTVSSDGVERTPSCRAAQSIRRR